MLYSILDSLLLLSTNNLYCCLLWLFLGVVFDNHLGADGAGGLPPLWPPFLLMAWADRGEYRPRRGPWQGLYVALSLGPNMAPSLDAAMSAPARAGIAPAAGSGRFRPGGRRFPAYVAPLGTAHQSVPLSAAASRLGPVWLSGDFAAMVDPVNVPAPVAVARHVPAPTLPVPKGGYVPALDHGAPWSAVLYGPDLTMAQADLSAAVTAYNDQRAAAVVKAEAAAVALERVVARFPGLSALEPAGAAAIGKARRAVEAAEKVVARFPPRAFTVSDLTGPRAADLSAGRGSRALASIVGATRAATPTIDRGDKPTPEQYGRGAPASPLNPFAAHYVLKAWVAQCLRLTYADWVRQTRAAIHQATGDKPTLDSIKCTVPTPAQVVAMLSDLSTVRAVLTTREGKAVKTPLPVFKDASLQALADAFANGRTVPQKAPRAVAVLKAAVAPAKRVPMHPAPAPADEPADDTAPAYLEALASRPRPIVRPAFKVAAYV